MLACDPVDDLNDPEQAIPMSLALYIAATERGEASTRYLIAPVGFPAAPIWFIGRGENRLADAVSQAEEFFAP